MQTPRGDQRPFGAARRQTSVDQSRARPCIGQSGGAPASTQGNAPAGSTELRQILPGSKFRPAVGPPVKPSIVRTWPADILTIDGQIQKTFHVLTPRWRLTPTICAASTRRLAQRSGPAAYPSPASPPRQAISGGAANMS